MSGALSEASPSLWPKVGDRGCNSEGARAGLGRSCYAHEPRRGGLGSEPQKSWVPALVQSFTPL
eukprot:14267773-Alexandrium_andersonii.AAC.1